MTIDIAWNPVPVSAAETAGFVTFDIVRSGSLTGDVIVSYDTIPLTTRPGLNYEATGIREVAIAEGSDRVSIQIDIYDDDLDEGTEQFSAVLLDAFGIGTDAEVRLGAPRTINVSILVV